MKPVTPLTFLQGFAWLLGFQLIGEILSRAGLPMPGPVQGMVLLLIVLIVRGEPPTGVEQASDGVLKSMSLFFIPAGVGVGAYVHSLGADLLPILIATVPGTLVALLVAGWVAQRLNRESSQGDRR